jgi:hypothetical protein
MATIFRGPIFTRYAALTSLAAALSCPTQELLATTLKPATATMPFVQADWPNPQIKQRSIDLLTEADASEFWILKDKIYRGVGQVPTYDWPNPLIPKRIGANETDIGNRFALKNTIPAAAPFSGSTFDNPTVRLRASVDLLTSVYYFVVDDNLPKSPIDWPNPQLRRGIDALTWTQSRIPTPPTQSPFSQTQWPNPQIAREPVDDLTEVDASEFWLLKDQFFGAAGQPPSPTPAVNPRGYFYAIDGRTWTQSHVLDTLAPVQATPFALTDWPNPRGPFATLENRTEADPSEFWLLKDTFFGGPGQPPSPTPGAPYRAAVWPIDGRTWLQNHLQDTLAPLGPTPFSLDDWPVPAGYRYPISLRTFAEFTRLLGKDRIFGGPGQPISNFQQPNPLGYLYPLELRTGFARQTLTTAIPALDASCIIQVGAESWVILVPVEPRVLDPEDD